MTDSLGAQPHLAANAVLASLADAEQTRLRNVLRFRDDERGSLLWEPGDTLTYVLFPVSGSVSLLPTGEDGNTIEVRAVGRDGLLGLPLILGGSVTAVRALTVADMSGFAISRHDLAQEVNRTSAELAAATARYATRVVRYMTQALVCARVHSVPQRIARWVMDHRDRVGTDDVRVTHTLLADLLGVQRPTLTLGMRQLEQSGAVHHRRGLLTVEKTELLVAFACECYPSLAAAAGVAAGARPSDAAFPPPRVRGRTVGGLSQRCGFGSNVHSACDEVSRKPKHRKRSKPHSRGSQQRRSRRVIQHDVDARRSLERWAEERRGQD